MVGAPGIVLDVVGIMFLYYLLLCCLLAIPLGRLLLPDADDVRTKRAGVDGVADIDQSGAAPSLWCLTLHQ